jgi:hypothetical protein
VSGLALDRRRRAVPLAELLWSATVITAVLLLLLLSLRLPHTPQPLEMRPAAPAAGTILLAPGQVAA